MADEQTDPRVNLSRALNQMGRVMDGADESRAADPTPCAGWCVRDLVAHIIGGDLPNFEAAARGVAAEWHRTPEPPETPWAKAYHDGSAQLAEAWAAADLEQTTQTPIGPMPLGSRLSMMIAELVVHTWDLARATGQDPDLDPELCEIALAWSKPMLKPELRGAGRSFGDEVPVPDSAPIQDRVIGWFGRDPNWSAG